MKIMDLINKCRKTRKQTLTVEEFKAVSKNPDFSKYFEFDFLSIDREVARQKAGIPFTEPTRIGFCFGCHIYVDGPLNLIDSGTC